MPSISIMMHSFFENISFSNILFYNKKRIYSDEKKKCKIINLWFVVVVVVVFIIIIIIISYGTHIECFKWDDNKKKYIMNKQIFSRLYK